MKNNKIIVQINRPVNEVFAYTITPMNTRKWVGSIIVEKTSEWPIRIGSTYTNKNKQTGEWSKYTVTDFEEFKIFELASRDKNYHVRYTYKPIKENVTELEYYEWVDEGELEEPFTQETLDRLKKILDSQAC